MPINGHNSFTKQDLRGGYENQFQYKNSTNNNLIMPKIDFFINALMKKTLLKK